MGEQFREEVPTGSAHPPLSDLDSRQRSARILEEVKGLALPPFEKALIAATRLHDGQFRKMSEESRGEPIPYISHLLAVVGLVMEGGATEQMLIAALLHDSVEDQQAAYADIAAVFGNRVSEIVRGCTDEDAADPGYERSAGNSWPRKQIYLEHLRAEEDSDIVRVALADRLHNARSVLADYRSLGDRLWHRFNVGKERQLEYYQALAQIFHSKLPGDSQARELDLTVREIVKISA